jgi:hypothetical protein
VVLSHKLRAPGQPELAIGAISEGGQIYLNAEALEALELAEDYLTEERRHQLLEIQRSQRLFRHVRPQASVAGRSVIVTDDGLATGATMLAALRVLKTYDPRELIVAVPVASPSRLEEVRRWCDDLVCAQTGKALGHRSGLRRLHSGRRRTGGRTASQVRRCLRHETQRLYATRIPKEVIAMQLPLQISFHNMGHSKVVEERVRDKAAKLERFAKHIMGCRVVSRPRTGITRTAISTRSASI